MIVALVVLIVAYIVFVLIRSGARAGDDEGSGEEAPDGEPEPAAAGEAAPPAPSAVALRRSFRRAMDRIPRFAAGPGARYKIPWFLVLGAAGSRKIDLPSSSSAIGYKSRLLVSRRSATPSTRCPMTTNVGAL